MDVGSRRKIAVRLQWLRVKTTAGSSCLHMFRGCQVRIRIRIRIRLTAAWFLAAPRVFNFYLHTTIEQLWSCGDCVTGGRDKCEKTFMSQQTWICTVMVQLHVHVLCFTLRRFTGTMILHNVEHGDVCTVLLRQAQLIWSFSRFFPAEKNRGSFRLEITSSSSVWQSGSIQIPSCSVFIPTLWHQLQIPFSAGRRAHLWESEVTSTSAVLLEEHVERICDYLVAAGWWRYCTL